MEQWFPLFFSYEENYQPIFAIVLFVPISAYYVSLTIQGHLATPLDWVVGIILGIVLNVVGILKMIDWLKDENTEYIFPKRFLIPAR